MSRSKVLWVVCLGALVVVLSVFFTWQKNQDKALVDKVNPNNKVYNPVEHYPTVPLEEDSDYYKESIYNDSELFYFSNSHTSIVSRIPTEMDDFQADKLRKGMIILNRAQRQISFSLPSGFADITETAYGENYIYPLKSNYKFHIDISVFPTDNICSISGSPYKNITTNIYPNKDKSIIYSAILDTTQEYRKNSKVSYVNQGLVFKIDQPTTSSQNMWNIPNLTTYPCVQIFPNPEDIELKKDHPEIYPEVIDIVKAIVESIRPINETK